METIVSGDLRKTPLYEEHCALKAKMAPFGGWLMPIQYEGIIAEHAHTRNNVSVFDICHMGEFVLEADPAASGLDRIVTQDIVSMPEGACRYGFMLNEQGGIVDDLVVYRMGQTSWMLVVNAATTPADELHLKRYLIGPHRLTNVSNDLGKLDIQGPGSTAILQKLAGEGVAKLSYYTFGKFTLRKENVIISRTGYTGERGFEVYISNANIRGLWQELLSLPGVKPAGLGARDTLRLEMCYPLYGQDIDAGRNPLEAGLENFVDFSKDFIGKKALQAVKIQGVRERLIPFIADSRRSPRHGFGIYVNGVKTGVVTSGSFSPSLASGIGMGYVAMPLDAGSKIAIKDGAVEISAAVAKRPLYTKGTARS